MGDSDRYVKRFSTLLSEVSQHFTGGIEVQEQGRAEGFGRREAQGRSRVERTMSVRYETGRLDRVRPAGDTRRSGSGRSAVGLGELSRWLVTGVGGILGAVGGGVVSLAFLYYMLLDRGEWMETVKVGVAVDGDGAKARPIEAGAN